jgi:dolichyl-phosphate-mannose--protein O-mannosyl transferase
MFDEVYHAVTAKLIAHNNPWAFEWTNPAPEPNTAVDWLHPPLAKYTQAASMLAFGENSFGWRFSSVIFGVGVIYLTYVASKKSFSREDLSLLAAFLASLDGLLLAQSRIAMNDIHVTFFILATFCAYLEYKSTHKPAWLVATGLAAGLAVISKWSGVFIIAAIGLREAVEWMQHFFALLINQPIMTSTKRRQQWADFLTTTLQKLAALIIIPLLIYPAGYWLMFAQGKDLAHFKELHNQIWWYQTHLEATHSYQSRPWQWFLNLRPVWFYVSYTDSTHTANIYALGNPVLHIVGPLLVIFTAILALSDRVMAILNQTKKKLTSTFESYLVGSTQPLLFILVSYALMWMPWFFSPRIMFYYHYTPAVPFLCMIVAYWLYSFWQQSATKTSETATNTSQLVVGITIMSICIAFVVWFPLWTGIPVPNTWMNSIYFALAGWK